jgi:2-dehydropantoate 2-reductase
MEIAIVGAGNIGATFAVILKGCRHHVRLIEILKDRVDLINSGKLWVMMPDGSEKPVDVEAFSYPHDLGPVDLIQISTKAYDTRKATEDSLPMVGQHTMVLSIQNGLYNLEKIAEVVGKERVIGGVTAHGVSPISPYKLRYLGGEGPLLTIGKYDRRPHHRYREIAQSLKDTVKDVQMVEDIESVIWKKLIANISTNPIAAFSGFTANEILACDHARELLSLLAEESAKVAKARGLSFDELDSPGEFVLKIFSPVKDHKISMLQDLEANRRTEIGELNGAIVSEGERLGVPTPVNRTIELVIKTLEHRSGFKSFLENGSFRHHFGQKAGPD